MRHSINDLIDLSGPDRLGASLHTIKRREFAGDGGRCLHFIIIMVTIAQFASAQVSL